MLSVFKCFGASRMWMVWGPRYTTSQNESTAQQWFQSGHKLFLLVEVVLLVASGILCMLSNIYVIYIANY